MAKIVKTKSGKYRIRVFVGYDENNKRHWKSITHEDKRALKRIAAEYEDGHRKRLDSVSFLSASESFIDKKTAVLSPSTIRGYRSMLNTLKRHYASFCALSVWRIQADELQRIINGLSDDGKSPKYIYNVHALISSVLSYAGIRPPDATLPQRIKPNVYEPTKEDVLATIEAAKGLRIEIPILLGIHGLRRGEICALRYPDDFDGNIVHVCRSKVYIGKNTNIDKAPKNYTSDRYVPLDPALVKKIKKQGFVTDYTLGALSEEFPDFLKRNKIPKYRFHDLRHFFVAYLHELGYSDAEIMYLGGWKTDAVMKRSYRYVLDKDGLAKRVQNDMKNLL